ncbi:MAG: caspase family protein [Chloroflexi bacterium]|nr:caspase family protein [Chloroflexota bacterium]MBU1750108.1 caspase family protein [Chloroflexota bacterium]MBU1879911.1 caspase family protein [Chloroflexota bacterium]
MADTFSHGYALLIGVDENQADGWALPDVARDIAALAAVLSHPRRCAYAPDHVKTITGASATRNGILKGLDWLGEQVAADQSGNATAVIYYTGHGWRDAQGTSYLIPYDLRADRVRLSALQAADFAEAVGALSPRRLLVVLDCCHAGAMGVKGALLPTGYVESAVAPVLFALGEAVVGPGAKGGPGFEALTEGQGRAVLSSSTGEQRSYLRQDGQMSIFTYHLIEALTGGAAPPPGAAEVLVSDVMSHVYRHVPVSARADRNAEQTPDFQMSGNFAVALLLGGQGLSKGQPAPDPLAPIEPSAPTVIDQSVHDDHSVHIKASGDVAYAAGGGTANIDKRHISTSGPVIMAEPGSTVHVGGIPTSTPTARPAAPGSYDLMAVRELLISALDDSALTDLAFDRFFPAHEAFGRGMGKTEKARVLVEYCARGGYMAELLEQVRRRNPNRYAEYEPRLLRH